MTDDACFLAFYPRLLVACVRSEHNKLSVSLKDQVTVPLHWLLMYGEAFVPSLVLHQSWSTERASLSFFSFAPRVQISVGSEDCYINS